MAAGAKGLVESDGMHPSARGITVMSSIGSGFFG
jgi:hypothetical protein